MSETRTYWLSFCNLDHPKGQPFLGACIVDVTADDAREALTDLVLRFPDHQDGAEWIAAAIRKAHRTGCNPGGEIATIDVTHGPAATLARYERNRLYSRAELEAIERMMSLPT